jgi:hypothetical protein
MNEVERGKIKREKKEWKGAKNKETKKTGHATKSC